MVFIALPVARFFEKIMKIPNKRTNFGLFSLIKLFSTILY